MTEWVRRNIGRIAVVIAVVGVFSLILQDDDVRHAVNPFDSPGTAQKQDSEGVVTTNGNSPSSQPGPPSGGSQTGTPAGTSEPSQSPVGVKAPVPVQVCTPLASLNCP